MKKLSSSSVDNRIEVETENLNYGLSPRGDFRGVFRI
tara:strand:- start:405 stop:515 length:111 start_codon:yes stop_codon:yes gene_type:complete